MRTGDREEMIAADSKDSRNIKEKRRVVVLRVQMYAYSDWRGPVSYTHLDVYKRQGYART